MHQAARRPLTAAAIRSAETYAQAAGYFDLPAAAQQSSGYQAHALGGSRNVGQCRIDGIHVLERLHPKSKQQTVDLQRRFRKIKAELHDTRASCRSVHTVPRAQ